MELHSEAGILLGNAQACLMALQTGNANNAMQDAGKTEGLAQALFQRSIKNIYHHFEYTREEIEIWVEKKKIEEHHKDSFLRYAEK